MERIELSLECPVHRSFRVEQMAGMFDVSLEEKLREEFQVEAPDLDSDWQIGCIVGPSGSRKTSVARELFSKHLYRGAKWPRNKAVLDGFPKGLSIKQVVGALTSVGFSSPPSWVKPYHVLSNGERFRCDLARALLSDQPVVAYDEFTSVVDRTVAKIGSAAVAKAIRKGRIDARFVAVTCHYDVLEWLQPDWTLDMASGRLARGWLPRPPIRLEIAPVDRSAWVLFRRHHYLTGHLQAQAKCFCAFWGEHVVGFSSWVRDSAGFHWSKKLTRRSHRTVVLPDFQGVGIGSHLVDFCASIWKGLGERVFRTAGHPAVVGYCSQSPLWKRTRLGVVVPGKLRPNEKRARKRQRTAAGRITGSFEYVGPGMDRRQAEQIVTAEPGRFLMGPASRKACSR